MFKKFSLKIKLFIPLMLVGIILIVVAGVGVLSSIQVQRSVADIHQKYLPGINNLLQADRDLYQALSAERSFIFLRVDSEEYKQQLSQHDENIKQARDRVEKFAALIATPQIDAKLAEFRTLFDEWEQVTRNIQEQRTNGGRVGRSTAIELTFGEGAKRFDAMRDTIDQLTEIVEGMAANKSDEVTEVSSHNRNLLITSALAGVIICVLIAILFPPLITRPIRNLLLRVEDISRGEGDLTARVEIESSDEIGQLAQAFNRFLQKLHDIVSSIAGSSSQLAAASEELSLITADSAQNLHQQHSATDQVATAVNEMSATVQEVAQNASDAATAATTADDNVQQGRQVVQQTVSAIMDLARDVDNAANVIRELNENSDSIGKVLDVIKGIAEQTNLLALNAAIEAARAGEQGRGFAVVADEVRTLASRTQESTQEIQEMIEKLQVGAENAVRVMDDGCNKAGQTVKLAEDAGESLNAITDAVTRISQMNIQIATAAEEQNAVTEEINRNVVNISQISDNTSSAAGQIESSSSTLAQLAADLQQQVDQFRI